ncbi:MAG: lipoprotein insertase outer membrane protein LolB, partial [SAR324 cluster bacterium]|nr:lipoprotein insertase outer membrane protein LolB [SAR324 cluster bacterium]
MIPNKVSVRVPGIILLPGLFLFLGCTTSSPPSPTISSKSESSHFLASGKVLFRQPDQKQSGDLELRYSDPGRFQLKIFTPLVGSLIYELRADKQQLMVLDYHNEWFVLKANDADARREWLGMDLSLEELGWLLQGIRERPPKGWSLISNHSESMRIIQAEKEISISFDPQGRILSLEKFNEGLAEYEVTI